MAIESRWSPIFQYEAGFLYWKIDANNNSAMKGDSAGFLSNPGDPECYVQVRHEGRAYQLSRIVWELHNGDIPDGIDVDHIDGNRLNNDIFNLRLATRSQNLQNRTKHVIGNSSHSVYKGVSKATGKRGWRAAIYPNGKTKWLGIFTTEIEAALAYDEAARELYGEFAKTNFVKKVSV